MDLIQWMFFIILAIIPLIYWYLNREFNYWSKRGIKGPKPIPILGNFLEFLYFNPQAVTELEWYKKYGKIYGYYYGKSPILTVADPELIKTVLVKDFHLFVDRKPKFRALQHPILSKNVLEADGDDWKRLRSITSPTFTSGKMKKMYPMIRECLKDFINHLQNFANNEKDIDTKEMFGNYSMDVIATCAFATKTNAHKDLDNPFAFNARKFFKTSLTPFILLLVLPDYILKLLMSSSSRGVKDSKSVAEFFINSTRHILANRRKGDNKYNDFIQLLMEAEKDKDITREDNDLSEAHNVNEGTEELSIKQNALNIIVTNKKLTEDEILAQAFIFLMAGYETTSTLLTFTTYELVLNQEIQEKLYEEITTAVDANGELNYEELAKLPYLDAVLSETLRMHSPVLRIARIPAKDYKLGDTGITLSKGQSIEFPIYAIHHSEEYYDNPFQYNPDRFMPENRHKLIPYTYLPFGAGPRNCIGMRFALLEAKLGLAQIIRRFRFVRSPNTDVPLKRMSSPHRLNIAKRVIVGIENRK